MYSLSVDDLDIYDTINRLCLNICDPLNLGLNLPLSTGNTALGALLMYNTRLREHLVEFGAYDVVTAIAYIDSVIMYNP